jgi:two-component system sensor histidine kinase UhpB
VVGILQKPVAARGGVAGFHAVPNAAAGATFGVMKSIRRIPARAVLPILLGAIAAIASFAVGSAPAPDFGFHLAYQDRQVVVSSVDYGSAAQSTGLEPGAVVTWVYGQYVLGMPDQAKRDIAQTQGSVVMMMTTTRDQVPAEEAAFARLVKLARQSDTPWLSSPETNPVPACLQYQSCDPVLTEFGTSYFSSFDGNELCVPTDGTRLADLPTVSAVLSGGTETSGTAFAYDASFCVLFSGGSPGYSPYGYVGPSDQQFFSGFWMPFGTGRGPTFLGLAILLFGWLIVGRGWAGSALRPYALTLPLATAVPLLVLPIDRYPTLAATVVGSVLVPLAMLPLAIDFLGRMDRGRRRRLVALITFGLAVGSAACGLLTPANHSLLYPRAFLAGCVVFVPGALAARPFHRLESGAVPRRRQWRGALVGGLSLVSQPLAARLSRLVETDSTASPATTPRALIERVDIFLAAMTPGIAAVCLTSTYNVDFGPLLLWLGALLIATRVIVRPLGRLATVAVRQRDLVVAATEAERSRIAADIHDDALQDLTMLVRRLDAAGDTENAQAAREIAERLRAICGDLKLPVLDDLGVGPALEWLCGRLEAKTESITLDRLAGESRLPADVELAVFRVAQEALSNAVRHGAPPVVVRYRSRPGWVELEVDDSGGGVEDGAAERAEQTGHLGILNMTQRAEAVGASLRIGRRPGGGTRVSLVWELAAAAGGAPARAPAPA